MLTQTKQNIRQRVVFAIMPLSLRNILCVLSASVRVSRAWSCAVVVAIAVVSMPSLALSQDFDWSFEEGDEGRSTGATQQESRPPSQSSAATGSVSRGAGFDWSWEEQPPSPSAPAGVSPTPPTSPARGVNATAYNELLRENMDLRKRIDAYDRDGKVLTNQKRRLEQEIADLEGRMSGFAAQIQRLISEKERLAKNSERVAVLESELTRAQLARDQLSQELARLRAAQGGETLPAPSVDPTKSDLFKELQQKNVELRGRLTELEEERQEALRDRARLAERGEKFDDVEESLKADLDAAKVREKEQKRQLEALLKRLPALEEELISLRQKTSSHDRAASATERELETLSLELQRREHRLKKAERMAELLEKTRGEVQKVSDQEKRDMHYNMGLVYAKEGRADEAEEEYLNALRLDPSDPDIHYNLGILYDDAFNDKRRAAMHYRRYIKLRPHASDIDTVRNWLMQIEMR